MKKVLLFGIVFLLTITVVFGQQARNTNSGSPEQPSSTIYLGDNGTFGHDSWAQNGDDWPRWQVVINQSSDLDDATAIWSGFGDYNNVEHKTATSPRFTAVGTWYWGMQVNYGDIYKWYCRNNTNWYDMWNNPTSDLTVTVQALGNPSDNSASSSSSSSIDLSWTKWNSKNVMVLRKLSSASWTEPTQGDAYELGNTIGSGTVVYIGSGTSFTDSDLLPNTSYDYKFYSENWSYYSDGVTSINITTDNTSATDYFRSNNTGDWNKAGNWDSSPNNTNWVTSSLVPGASATTITILDGHNITLNDAVTVSSLTINSGATFTASDGSKANQTLTISDGGTLTNNGTFTAADGTVSFAGAGTVAGSETTTFNDVDISGEVNFGSSSTINGDLTVLAGGAAITNAPTFASTSNLIFATGGLLNISNGTVLWSTGSTLGKGVPANVIVSTTTPLNIYETRYVTGNLTINSGGKVVQGNNGFTIQGDFTNAGTFSFVGDGTNPLVVKGDLINQNGATITLSEANGGDMHLEGDYQSSGTINFNNRAIFFKGGNAQSVTGANDPINFDYLFVEKTAATTLTFEQNVSVNDKFDQISGNTTIASGKTLTIDVSAVADVASGSTLTTNGNLLLNSDATGTGSLITNGTVTGDVTVECYLAQDVFHYIASPINYGSGSFNDLSLGLTAGEGNDDFRKYETSSNTWIDILNGPNGNDPLMGSETFVQGRGYAIAYAGENKTISLSGTLNNGDIDVAVSSGGVGNNSGANLIGNPYPSTLKASAFLAANNSINGTVNQTIGGTLYFWDEPTSGSFEKGDYAYRTSTTGTPGGGNKTPTDYINPGQGFFVSASSDGNVAFRNAQREHGTSTFFKSESLIQDFKLSVQNIATSDINTIAVVFDENSTIGFDELFDAPKWQGNPDIALYSLLGDQKLAIQSLPSIEAQKSVPIGLYAGKTGEYLFNVHTVLNFDEGMPIYLEDTKSGEKIDLTVNPDYLFTVTESGYINDRFIVHFGILTGVEDQITTPKAFAYINGNNLHVRNMEGDYTLRLNDISGRNIMQQQINGNAEIALPSDLNAGVYLVEITSGSNRTVQKVVIN